MNRLVSVIAFLVDTESREHPVAKRILREHAIDRLMDQLPRVLLELVLEGNRGDTARVAREAVIHLVSALVAGHVDTVRVDNDDEIASIDMRSIVDLVLADQYRSNLGRETTKYLPLCIKEVIFPIDHVLLLCHREDCLDEFDDSHASTIALSGIDLYDTSITALASIEAGSKIRDELLDGHLRELLPEFANHSDTALLIIPSHLGLTNDLVDVILDLLGLRLSRSNALMENQAPKKGLDERSALVSAAREDATGVPVLHMMLTYADYTLTYADQKLRHVPYWSA